MGSKQGREGEEPKPYINRLMGELKYPLLLN